MKILSGTTNYDFLGKQKLFFLLSALLVGLSIYVWFEKGPEKYGVDFLGGHEFVIQFKQPTNSGEINSILQQGGMDTASVQSFEAGSNLFSVRLQADKKPEELKSQLDTVLGPKFQGNYEIVRTDYVGPTVGAELRRKAMLAVAFGLLGMLIYVAIRFEMAFAIGAVVAVFHDVIVATGVYLLAGHAINMATLAAALTIVGYSVNDTIVIYDRVREELNRNRKEGLSSLVNRSINASLSRTLITQFLTLLAVLSLLLFGGGAIADLSLFLFVGMLSGCYSTMYIAAPVTIAWHKFRGGSEEI